MNTKPQAPRRPGSAVIRLLCTMLVVWMLGAIYMPAVAATPTTVTVDQQPLSVQQAIPPNVMLMLDDSGSMAWDFMPDACYLYGVTCGGTSGRHGSTTCNNGNSPINNVGNGTGQCVDTITAVNNQAVIDASNNGVYYNPTVVYTPPPKASSGSYTSYTDFTNVPVDGFNTSNGTANVTNYSSNDLTGENNSDSDTLSYSTSTTQNVTGTFNQTVSSTSSWWSGTTYADQVCTNDFNSYNGNSGTLVFTGTTSTGSGSNLKWTQGQCTFTYPTTATYYYFQYATGAAAGPYTTYYVAPASQGCGTQTNCVVDTDTSGTSAPATDASGNALAAGTNIANWFAYYHTRIQMAKSGLMTAFSTVSSKFRVGFGSIDNNGQSAITSLSSSLYGTFNSQYIAYVQPFGNGSSGTQKANFWNWAASINPNNGTPLRLALDSVGQYYQTAQPWTTMSSDPNYGTSNQPSNIACRQAYTILTTDGFWNEGNPPSTETGASNAAWPAITGPNGQSWPSVSGSKPSAPYSGGAPSSGPSLADVALYYWENDLATGASGGAPNIANEVPTNKEDPAFWQHMVTFTMGLGFTPTGISGTAKIGTNSDTPPSISDIFSVANGSGTLTGFSWPTPSSNSLYNISDLAHAGVNGHGGFYSATSPAAFASGLTDALNRASSRVGSGASLAANSTQLTNGTVAYQAQYHTVQWSGDLLALSINSSTGAISPTASWSASSMLLGSATVAGKLDTYPNRAIWTYVPPASSSGTGSFVQFVNTGTGSSATPPSLSSAQLTALGSSATAQASMVSYLRGDNTSEQVNNGTFRTRTTPLGDIVDSQPVYSGAPNPNEFENQVFVGMSNTASTGDNSFQAFAVGTTNATTGVSTPSAASTRTGLVFVAANDGMLHAFNASTGTEVYAYLPGAVITSALKNLSDPTYGQSTTTTAPHQYYNDGELTIADAFIGSAWHTILVGTTGRGLAQAVYALDITNPSSITPLWERSAGDGQTNSNYIGQMVGKPIIAKVQDKGTNADWQVVIGNGYNSSAGTAALLEFNLATGALNVHTTDATAANGLAAPVTWLDNPANGISMEAYAGDLAGRVWTFPLDDATTTTSGSGSSATTTTTYAADLSAAGTKVFTATDPSGKAQPITAGMLAGRDPVTGNVWVFFGTGEYLSSTDITNTQVQNWYGVIVQAGANSSTLPSLPVTTLDGSMVERYITYEQDANPSATPPTLGVRTVTQLPVPSDMPGKRGWYMNLEQPTLDSNGNVTGYNALGERMVTPNQFQGNLLLGTTRIPTAASSSDICNASGTGWVMAVDPFTGTNPSGNFFMVNGSSGSVTLPNGKTLPVAGVGFSSLPNNPIFVGGDMLMSFDNGSTSNLSTSGASGIPQRVSWKELVNP
nr:PilC/PilY family type IV pilus protein [Dyella sp. ASV24]